MGIMSRRHRYTTVGDDSRPHFSGTYTTAGIPIANMSVPLGCISPYAGMPFTLDGGHTFIDPWTGRQVVQTIQPKVHYDPYGRVVGVSQQPVYQPVPPPVPQQVQQPIPQQVPRPVYQPTPPQVQQPVTQTDILVNQRTGERIVVPRRPPAPVAQPSQTPYDAVFGSTQVQTQPQPRHTQTSSQMHPSIVETGHRDQFSGKELIKFKDVECYPPNGVRNYIFNSDRTAVTLVVTEPNGAQWSRTLDI